MVLRAKDRNEPTDFGDLFDKADKDTSGTLDRGELDTLTEEIGLDADLFLKS